jgi:hypothetical protein
MLLVDGDSFWVCKKETFEFIGFRIDVIFWAEILLFELIQ